MGVGIRVLSRNFCFCLGEGGRQTILKFRSPETQFREQFFLITRCTNYLFSRLGGGGGGGSWEVWVGSSPLPTIV